MQEGLAERTVGGLHTSLCKRLPKIGFDRPVLDVGCGTGAWLERLASVGFTSLHGIDQDVRDFKTSKATCSQLNLDHETADFDGNRFGLMSAIELVEHLENPGRLFQLVSTHLADDGYFLLTTPNIHSIHCRLRFLITGRLASFDDKGDPTHIYPVLLTSFERLLPRYSLRIIEKWGFPSQGSLVYRNSVRLVSQMLGAVLPHQQGDTLCMLIQKEV